MIRDVKANNYLLPLKGEPQFPNPLAEMVCEVYYAWEKTPKYDLLQTFFWPHHFAQFSTAKLNELSKTLKLPYKKPRGKMIQNLAQHFEKLTASP